MTSPSAKQIPYVVSELAKINRLKRPYRLQPGQTIRGPGGTAKAYVVQSGDTLAEIAQRFSTTVDKLRSANGLRRGASVAPGRRLRLPAGYRDRGPIASEAPRPAPPRPQPPSSFDTPPPVGQTLPPPRSAPRPPTVQLPGEPQPYRPSTPQPYRPSGPPVGAPTASPQVSDAQISQMGRGLFAWPVRGQILYNFGSKGTGQRNDGLNIRAITISRATQITAHESDQTARCFHVDFGNFSLSRYFSLKCSCMSALADTN